MRSFRWRNLRNWRWWLVLPLVPIAALLILTEWSASALSRPIGYALRWSVRR